VALPQKVAATARAAANVRKRVFMMATGLSWETWR
jgi:hypothetical protein